MSQTVNVKFNSDKVTLVQSNTGEYQVSTPAIIDGVTLTSVANKAAVVGSQVTNMNATELKSGTVDVVRLPVAIPAANLADGSVDNAKLQTLSDISTAMTVQSQLNLKANAADLSVVATTGVYADLLAKPTLGTVAPLDTGVAEGNVPVLDVNGALPLSTTPTGINAIKIGNGDVNNTTLSYLSTVTSPVQAQIETKQALVPTAVANDFAVYDNAGQVADTGLSLSTVTSLAGASNTTVPSTLVVKTYSDNQAATKQNLVPTAVANDFVMFNNVGQVIDGGLSFTTDGTLGANSDLLIPSEKAIRSYTTYALTNKANLVNNVVPQSELPLASTTLNGVAKLATQVQVDAGAADVLVTPATLQAAAVFTTIQNQIATKVNSSLLAVANGVATLGADGKVPSAQLPTLAVLNVTPVATQADMLALTFAQEGDVVVVTSDPVPANNGSFIFLGGDTATLANWVDLAAGDTVTTVNGYAGPTVVLTKADVELGNVDNIAAVDLPVSIATGLALATKADTAALSTVATSGSYTDLSNTPALGSVAALNAGLVEGNVPALITGDVLPVSVIPTGVSAANVADGTVSNAAFQRISGLTSDAQTQIDAKASTVDLATVATSGSYTDLTNKPVLGSAAALSAGFGTGNVVVLATGGLLPNSVLPTNISAELLANGSVTNTAFQYVANLTSDAQTQLNAKVSTASLATVATSGEYADLLNKPVLGSAALLEAGTAALNVVQLDATGVLPAVSGASLTGLTKSQVGLENVANLAPADLPVSDATNTALSTKADTASLAAVATTGLYSDLIGKPMLINEMKFVQVSLLNSVAFINQSTDVIEVTTSFPEAVASNAVIIPQAETSAIKFYTIKNSTPSEVMVIVDVSGFINGAAQYLIPANSVKQFFNTGLATGYFTTY